MSKRTSRPPDGPINLERIIASKNPALLRWIPGFAMRYLKRIVHLREVNETLVEAQGMHGLEFAHFVLERLGVSYRIYGLERIPTGRRYFFVCNHPLGGLDGLVLIALMGDRFGSIYFPVNDILTRLEQLQDIFLPINKHGAQKSVDVARLLEAYASDAQILYFPAGLCSRKLRGRVQDLEWKPHFVAKAVEYQRDVVPLYFEGRNSSFFYNLSRFRHRIGLKANIEMVYLVDEMFRQKGADLRVHVGRPIPWQELANWPGDRRQCAAWVREQTYALKPGVESDTSS